MPTWLCPIPGADPTTMAFHAALMLGLAAFVLVAGTMFLVLALIAYRRPLEPMVELVQEG